MILAGTSVGHNEIINAFIVLQCNFVIYRNENFFTNNNIFEIETIINKYDKYINHFLPIILLTWVNNNHFKLLLPKNNIDNVSQINSNNKELINNINANEKYTNNKKLILIIIRKNPKILKNPKKKCGYETSVKNKKANNDKTKNDNTNLVNTETTSKDNINTELEMKYKDYLSNYIKNDDSIYPELKGMKDGKNKLYLF